MGIAFEEAKKSYEQMREQERKKLIKYLKNHTALINSDLDVVTDGPSGNGDKNYTSGGRIAPYDLSNWKWVECKNPNGGFSAMIELAWPLLINAEMIIIKHPFGLTLIFRSIMLQ